MVNLTEQYVNKECHPLNKRHDEIAIPTVVQLSTGILYSLFVSKMEQILIPLDLKYSKSVCVFDAWYFKYSKFHGNLPTIPCSDIYQKDLICSVLLQHHSKKTYYYCVWMDWKELILCLDGLEGTYIVFGWIGRNLFQMLMTPHMSFLTLG